MCCKHEYHTYLVGYVVHTMVYILFVQGKVPLRHVVDVLYVQGSPSACGRLELKSRVLYRCCTARIIQRVWIAVAPRRVKDDTPA